MKISICDDIKEEREQIKKCLEKNTKITYITQNASIELYSPTQLNNLIQSGKLDCDIVIMDIEFENVEFDGIFLAKKINEFYPDCKIIYLSHILEFAPNVYETNHCYFVMKNNMETMIPRAVSKAVDLIKMNSEKRLLELSVDGSKKYIKQADIIYIEKLDRKTYIHTANETYDIYMSLSSIMYKLNNEMVRCHSSFIINLSNISNLSREFLTLSNGTEIPIGKTYRDKVKEEYLKYWTLRS